MVVHHGNLAEGRKPERGSEAERSRGRLECLDQKRYVTNAQRNCAGKGFSLFWFGFIVTLKPIIRIRKLGSCGHLSLG